MSAISSLTLQQILNQKQQYSQLSEQPSFTLTDILQEPIDQDVIDDNNLQTQDIDNLFDDYDNQNMFEDQNQGNNQTLKPYEFPSLTQQYQINMKEEIKEKDSSQQELKVSKESNIKTGAKQATNYQQQNDIASGQANVKNQSPTLKSGLKSSKRISTVSQSTITVPQIKRHNRLSSMPLLPIQEINNMSYVLLKNVTSLFQDTTNTSIGIPTSISATGNRFLAIGTSMGNIVLFEIGIKGHKILGTTQQRKFGFVSSISISADNKYLVAGHQSGLVAVWDLYYFNIFKQQINSKSKIFQVLFCSQTSQNFISNDTEGNTYIYTIQRYIWTNLKSQKLLQKSPVPFYDIRYHQLQTKSSILAMCTLDYVILISIKPQIKMIGKIVRPDGISMSYIPNVQMGRCAVDGTSLRGSEIKPMYDVLLISWGANIYLYRLVPSAGAFAQLEELYVYKHPTGVYNIEYLSQNIFVTLDNHQIFRTIRVDIALPSVLQTLQQIDSLHRLHKQRQKQNINSTTSSSSLIAQTASVSSSSSKTPNVSFSIIHTKQMQEQVIYQRLIKTKQQKYIKSFTNTMVNCTLNTEHKQIFFICKNSIFRSRLHKWTTFLAEMVNQNKNLKMAMKLAIQLKNQKLNIFTQKVDTGIYGNSKKGQKAMTMFCQVGKIFVQQSLKQIKKVNIDRSLNAQRAQVQVKQIQQQLKQMYQYAIQYFIQLKCQKYLFEQIYGKIIKRLPSYQYWHLFFDSLKSFIISQKLVRIPSIEIFKEILEYFSETKSNSSEVDNIQLIDKMIINLEADSLHYQNAVSILSDNKLYKALAYMCSVNKDFISPCNKIISKIMEYSDSNLQNAQKQYFVILEQYLTKLINGYYINDKKIPPRIYQMHLLRDISLWISFQDSLQYFLRVKQVPTLDKKPLLPLNFKLLLEWISKLVEQCSKLSDKHNFHYLIQHLIQSLNSIQSKQIMKKNQQSSNNTNLPFTKRDLISYFRYELALMILKYCKTTDLNTFQIQFYIKIIYESLTNKYNSRIKGIQFTKIQLIDQLQFHNKYFLQLHLVEIPQFKRTQAIHTPYAFICSDVSKNDWVMYLFNFINQSILKKYNKEQVQLEAGQEISEVSVKDQINQKEEKDTQKLHNSDAKSEQIVETNKLRSSNGSTDSKKLAKSTQFIESIFPQNHKYLDVFSQSNLIKRRKQLIARIKQLNITSLPLQTNIQQLTDSFSRHQNYTLVQFILKHFQFQDIDPHIESLLKLNSQLMIVYILENYEIQIVNRKIEEIKDEQIKYFVVRRIIKELRKLKEEKEKKKQLERDQSSKRSKSKKQSSRVWGNQYRTYSKKKQSQSLSTSRIKPKSTLFQLTGSGSSSLQKPTILFYFRCLTKYKKQKRILFQLKRNMQEYQFFIPDILKIVQQNNLNSCIGLLFEQMHQLDKAFEYYQLVYNERMDVNTHKLALKQHCHGRFLRQIFNQMLDLCKMINTPQQWMKLLEAVLQPLTQANKYERRRHEQVIDLIQFVFSNNPNHAFIQQFGQVIQITLLQVSSNTPIQQISSVFSQYSQLMNKTFMLNCLKSTMHTYSKTIFIYQTSNKMVISDQASQFQTIYMQNKIKGISYVPICQYCNQIIQHKDNVIIYKCSHMYHKICIQPDQDKCKKCVLIQVGQLKRKNIQHASFQLQQLKTKKKQQALTYPESNRNLTVEQVDRQQKQGKQNQEQKYENQKTITIYKCLAFDEYLERQEMEFDKYREDYDGYLSKYQ